MPDELRKVLKANAANILRKVKEGKTLTRPEKELLEEFFEAEGAESQPPGKGAPKRVHGREVADSMKAAAAMTGIPLVSLKRMKAAGCPAFRNSQVYLGPLREWMEEHDPDELPPVPSGASPEGSKVDLEIKRERRRNLQLKNDVLAGRLVPVEEAEQLFGNLALEARAALLKLPEELPSLLEGKDAARIRRELRKAVDGVCGVISKAKLGA